MQRDAADAKNRHAGPLLAGLVDCWNDGSLATAAARLAEDLSQPGLGRSLGVVAGGRAPALLIELAAYEKAPLCGAFSTRPTGFEPVTFGSVDRRSIQLSYGRPRASEDSGHTVVVAVGGASGEGGIRTRDGR